MWYQSRLSLKLCSYHSKGDLENAVQHLELYVEVAERSGEQEPLAKACSAIGVMYNTLVSTILTHSVPVCVEVSV